MNVERRIAALQREIRLRRAELNRVRQLQEAEDGATLAFPDRVASYITGLIQDIESREEEIKHLEAARHSSF